MPVTRLHSGRGSSSAILLAAIALVTVAATAPVSAQTCARASAGCSPAPAPALAPAPQSRSAAPRDTAVRDSTAVSEESVDAGRKIFHGRGTCYACHGASLEGGPIAPTLRAHPWKDATGGSLDAIYRIVTHGVPGTVMVSHPGGISDADAQRVASYIWAVSHGHARP